MTEVLSNDMYRAVELSNKKKCRFTTTAHVSQLKPWKLFFDGDEETEIEDNGQRTGQGPEEPAGKEVRRSARQRKTPDWTQDYSIE